MPLTPTRRPFLTDGARERLLAVAVFCSGGIALVLEQICEKYLSTLVGSSRYASTIVLAVYFTGLALGAFLCPKNPVGAPRRLAVLEAFIAAWAVVVGLAFFATDRALGQWLAQADGSAVTLAATRAGIAILWILPPTLAMGAQLPTLAAVLSSHPLGRSRGITHYYAVNLAGAFTFTVLTPPLLFNTVGADGALWSITLLGFAVAAVLWLALPNAAPSATTVARPSFSLRQQPGPIAGAFVAGFGFFALEVIWFHLISAVCGASVYSFSILLAVVLLGLALGGRAAARQAMPLAPLLGWLVAALAVGNALWPWAGPLMARVAATQNIESFWVGELAKLGVVAFIALPSAALAGQVFPRLLRRTEESSAPGHAVGALCATNVVGCIAGALVAGFVLIPAFGAERALQGLTLLVAAGWLALALRRPRYIDWFVPGAIGLGLLMVLPTWDRLRLTSGHAVYLREAPLPAGSQLAFFREDFATGFVTVVEHPQKHEPTPVRVLLQNGKFDADDAGEMRAQLGFGLVASLHAPATNRALVIGCGSGQTLSILARLGFDHVDLAELSPAHLAAAREQFAHINAGVLDRPGVHVHIEDGRNHLLRTRERFDAIQIELTSVWFAGATNLYSREFYALARSRLAPGGVLVQWIQLHHLTPREIASILASAQAEFRYVSVWRVDSQACFLASDEPPTLNPAVWERWRNDPALAAERRITGPPILDEFRATELVPAARLPALLAATPTVLNTDRNRWLEFQTPKYALDRRKLPAINAEWLRSASDSDPSRVGVVAPSLTR
jgi:Predicted spermidine synthase with an N-terminal membrane domain